MVTRVSDATEERASTSNGGALLRSVAQLGLVLLMLALVIRAGYYVRMVFPMLVWPHEAVGGEATMLYVERANPTRPTRRAARALRPPAY
jgi:hypothetical protein